jgi:Leucine-rich repeat (LRR) protein
MAAREFTTFVDALKVPDKVRRLYVIVRSRATRLPDFRLFPALEELTLHGALAHVTRFPDIFECAQLRSLTLTSTGITKIPPGFARLARLEQLALVGHRKLTALPDDIVELPKLKILNIDSNRLKHLPADLGKLRSLQELRAYNNALRELPASLFQLKRLRWLELQCNQLVSPPTRLMKMKLTHLHTDFAEVCRYR